MKQHIPTQSVQQPSENPKLTLRLIPCGDDGGNGFRKFYLFDKGSKIPNTYSTELPLGELSERTMTRIKPKAFSLQFGKDELWFGQDALTSGTGREIDENKYQKEYIRRMFSASLVQWLKRHNEQPDILNGYRLSVVSSMPPEPFQDKSQQNIAATAYRKAFNEQLGWFVKSSEFPTFQVFTQFNQITPETITFMATRSRKMAYSVVFDIGYGTLDVAVFELGKVIPTITKTLRKLGLIYAFQGDIFNPGQAELDILRSKNFGELDNYFSNIRMAIYQATRTFPKNDTEYIAIGGGTRLMSKEVKASFQNTFNNIIFKDEYVNAVANYQIAKRKIEGKNGQNSSQN